MTWPRIGFYERGNEASYSVQLVNGIKSGMEQLDIVDIVINSSDMYEPLI